MTGNRFTCTKSRLHSTKLPPISPKAACCAVVCVVAAAAMATARSLVAAGESLCLFKAAVSLVRSRSLSGLEARVA